ncbi:zinc finger protein 567-like [Diaphorina citri]|uniref:Zinc finger protein 567-like n=1 Tax=Diaphorina citri TaxID=121845 RepID=A0A1S3DKV3_DIACI|nr:zinc finger protein 567-like [Diaphorina citri]
MQHGISEKRNRRFSSQSFERDQCRTVYICHVCNQLFREKLVLQTHVKIEHDYANMTWYTCNICCNVLYMCEQDIQRHMIDKHNVTAKISVEKLTVKRVQDVTYPCQECGKVCILSKFCSAHASLNTQKHEDSTSELKDLKSEKEPCSKHSHPCQKCHLKLVDCNELWFHMFKTHDDWDFECNLCSASERVPIKYGTLLSQHMKQCHGKTLYVSYHSALFKKKAQISIEGVTKYKCLDCSAILSSFYALQKHVSASSCHQKVPNKSVTAKFKALFTERSESSESSKKIYECDICKKQVTNRKNMIDHQRSVHELLKPYECDTCGHGLSSKKSLDDHYRIHTGEKKYVCQQCGASFTQWASLFYHKFSHSETRNQVCSYCGKTYKNPNHLRSHLNTHTKKRLYVCETCGKEFMKLELLKSHLTTHLAARPFICEFCSAGFKTKKHLSQHHRTHKRKE